MEVCLVGTGRCGTTLLRELLHRHPGLYVFDETHWVPQLDRLFGSRAVSVERLRPSGAQPGAAGRQAGVGRQDSGLRRLSPAAAPALAALPLRSRGARRTRHHRVDERAPGVPLVGRRGRDVVVSGVPGRGRVRASGGRFVRRLRRSLAPASGGDPSCWLRPHPVSRSSYPASACPRRGPGSTKRRPSSIRARPRGRGEPTCWRRSGRQSADCSSRPATPGASSDHRWDSGRGGPARSTRLTGSGCAAAASPHRARQVVRRCPVDQPF